MARYIDADKLIAQLKESMKLCEPPYEVSDIDNAFLRGTFCGLNTAQGLAETLAKEGTLLDRDRYFIREGEPPMLIETSANRRSKIAQEIIDDFLDCVPKRLEGHSQETEIGYLLAVNEVLQAIHKLQRKYRKE